MPYIKIFTREVDLETLYEKNYDQEKFLGFCKECRNYAKKYTCPPFEIDACKRLEAYNFANFVVLQMFYSPEEREAVLGQENSLDYTEKTLQPESKNLHMAILSLEGKYPESLMLGMGGCRFCDECMRPLNKPCKKPEIMRVSPEAIGFDVAGILKDYFAIDICWCDGSLPEYYSLLGALLSKESLEISPSEIIANLETDLKIVNQKEEGMLK